MCIRDSYPVSGHWIWGGGWLSQLGFHDFAGSTAVHMVGGICALIGAAILGPDVYKRQGHIIIQLKQPTHLFRSMQILPSSICKAPEIQLFTHNGSSQWRQETAKWMLSFPSTIILGKDVYKRQLMNFPNRPRGVQ